MVEVGELVQAIPGKVDFADDVVLAVFGGFSVGYHAEVLVETVAHVL